MVARKQARAASDLAFSLQMEESDDSEELSSCGAESDDDNDAESDDDNAETDDDDYDESGEAMERRAGVVADLLQVARPIARSLLLQVQPSHAGTTKQRKHRKQLNRQLAAAAEASLRLETRQLGSSLSNDGSDWRQDVLVAAAVALHLKREEQGHIAQQFFPWIFRFQEWRKQQR